tara:strand:+ start:53 stop:268 length:216 start_codon:yes stop_codon:yes gene_type:complete
MQTLSDLYKQKRKLELDWEQHHLNEGKYTLDMVRIDHRVRELINEIKMEEAKLAQTVNKVEDATPSVSVAT